MDAIKRLVGMAGNTYNENEYEAYPYKSMITSVGDGGRNINVADLEDEVRGLRPAYPYGFATSPPPNINAWVLCDGQDDDIIGVDDPNRPSIDSGASMIYSIGGAIVRANADGSIDINTATGKTAKYNGVELGTGQGYVTEARVIELIGENVDEEFVSELGFLTEDDVDEILDDYNTNVILGEVANLIATCMINASQVKVDQATDIYEYVTYMKQSLDGFATVVKGTSVTVNTLTTVIERRGQSNLHMGKTAPPTITEDVDDGDYYIVSQYGGDKAGWVYIYDEEDGWTLATVNDITQDQLDALKTAYEYQYQIVDKTYKKSEVNTLISQEKSRIDLVVSTLEDEVNEQLTEIEESIDDIDTTLLYHQESITTQSSSISVLQTGLALKADSSTVSLLTERVGDVELTTTSHTASISAIPGQITSTVTSAVNNIKVGGRNLIYNSQTLDYSVKYYFDEDTSSALLGEMVLGDGILGG